MPLRGAVNAMLRKLFGFLVQAAIAGLVAAAVLVAVAPRTNRDAPALPAPGVSAPPAAPGAGEAALGQFRGFAAAVARAAPAVVSVYASKSSSSGPRGGPFRRDPSARPAAALGSGVVVSGEGYVLTNNHVVEGAAGISVALSDGRVAEARTVGVDPESDLAVLRVDAKDLQPIALADSDALRVGDVALAVGNPLGVGQTVTQGIVSATGRNRLGINTFENFIQTDAAINPGNSGGALLDADGRLIGINTAIFSQSGGSEGIGFAIPANLARQVMEQLVSRGRVERGYLGVAAEDVTHESLLAPHRGAARVSGVQPGGPADRAGIRPGDVIVAINDTQVADVAALVAATAALAPGSRAKVTVTRGRETREVEIVAGRRPPVKRAD